MNELNELYTVLRLINKTNEPTDSEDDFPVFSFEGLPGAGKTTQIKLVAKALSEKYGKTHYIDLPSDSSIGFILKALYADPAKWQQISKTCPWFNPVMISADLRTAIRKARTDGAICALMSRGIISTYYYNIDAYQAQMADSWEKLEKHLRGFIRPTAIVFLDIPESVAHERVLKRNRGPLRKMDNKQQMEHDIIKLKGYLNKIKETPVHFVNADGDKGEITGRIMNIITTYLPTHRV